MVDPAFASALAGADGLLDAAAALHDVAPPLHDAAPPVGALDVQSTTPALLQDSANATTTTADCATGNAPANGTTRGTAHVDCESGAWWEFTWLKALVETATGWAGLAIIAVYSFLIAFVLPLPSEVVLLAPLKLGFSPWAETAVIVVVSGLGKAAGSLFAFHIGQEAKEAGPVIRFLRRSRFDVVEWSEKKTVEIARRWGYVGLALALCVPGFPDTLSIYAFSVLEEDYLKFALATFVGSAGRLVLWAAGAEAVLAVI